MNSLLKYLFLVIVFFMWLNTTEAQNLQKVTLQLKWKHQFQFAGYYAAIEKGFYKEAGLEVKLNEAIEGINPSLVVLERKAEFGVCTSDILLMRSKNIKAVLLASIFQHSPQILVASRKSGIESVQNLVGKRIALEPNSADIIAMMMREGVNPDKCVIDEHKFNIEQLMNGEIDAISAYSSDELYTLREANFDYIQLSPNMSGIDFYGDVLFTTDSFIQKNPELVDKFRDASLKGWKYAMENQEEIIQLIFNKYSKRHSVEHLRYEANAMNKLIMSDVVEIGYSNPGRWMSIANIFKEQNLLNSDFTTDGLLYSDYQKQKTEIPWMILIALVAIIASIVFIAYYFYQNSLKLKHQIEQRALLENDLRESEEKFKRIIKTSPDGIAISTLDGTIQFVNAKILSMWSFGSVDEVLGRNTIEFLHPDYHEKAISSMTEMFKGNFTGAGEYLMVRKDGSTFYCEINADILRDADNNPTGIMFIERDITERKINEDKITKLSVGVEQSPVSIVITDKNGIIEYANPKFCELTGYLFEEVVGKNPRILKSINTPSNIFKDLWDTILSGKVWHGELINQKKNGEIYWESASISPIINKKGEITHFIALKEDISLRKKNEEEQEMLLDQLRESNELIELNLFQKNSLIEELSEAKYDLEKLNSEKDKFFSIIAHDLKSPFSGFLGLTKIMSENVSEFTLAELQDLSKSMQESASNLYKLLENLLEWARIQRDAIDFRPEMCMLPFIVKQILEVQSVVAKDKEIQFINNIPEDISVNADIPMLNTILRNLISNSIKFTPRDGKVEVGIVNEASEGLKPSETYTVIYVKDSGIGMTSDMIDKLFELGSKVSRPGTENEPSTGLGLLLCKEFVEKHSGKIWVESEVGVGSTFYFSMPK